MTERVLLLVDTKNQTYRACAVHSALRSGRTFTGGLYGVLMGVSRAIKDVGATSVAFATDAGPYARKLDYTEYKGDRDKDKDEALLMQATSSVALIKEFLTHVTIPFWSVRGYEYDDIAAWAVTQYGPRFDRVVAMTNDSDLYQVFFSHPEFSVYRTSKEPPVDMAAFSKQYPEITSARQWVKMLAITGTHNGVPGVKGVGEKTVLKALRDKAKWRTMQTEYADMIERNEGLITLPHARFPVDPDLRLNRHSFKLRDVVDWLEGYKIKVTPTMLEALDQINT